MVVGEVLSTLGAAKTVSDIVKALTEALGKKNPDWTTARALASDLQQAAYELQSENLTLQRQIVQLESEKSSLRQQLASEDAWNQRIKDLELYVKTPGGAVVHRSKTTPQVYFCPSNCFESHRLIPLQDQGTSSDYCQGCGKFYGIKPRRSSEVDFMQAGPSY